VVVETIELPNPDLEDEATVFYYGCDDFVLPDPLPEL
jgi:hypothetical protein